MANQEKPFGAAPSVKSEAQRLIDRYNELIGARHNWESYWQSLHDYFYLEAQNLNKTYYPGTELDTTFIWDATTLESADVFASGFMNYLTPPTSKWFRLKPKNQALANSKAVANYLEQVADEVNHALNGSNFYQQMFPSYKSSGVYGTSVLLEEDDLEDDIRFLNLPLKQVLIVEDAAGRVIQYYIEFEWTAIQAASKFGQEKLSTVLQEELKNAAPEKKHTFLLFIGKRDIREVQKSDKGNMPIRATWIEKEASTIVLEDGYHEMPAMTHRFDKRPFMPWGFSPAMKALPFARMLNAAAKTNMRQMMKQTDPPMAMPHNAFLMPFNANPRALNYYNKDHMSGGSKDVFEFGNKGNVQTGLTAVEYYSGAVKRIMYNDIFLKFEGITKQMQNPEVMEMINEKMSMLGPAVGRYITEILTPIIIRTVGILWRKGKLPEPPDEMRDDPTYLIDFVGVLAQAQRRAELNTLITGMTLVGQAAEYDPRVLHKIDGDKFVDEVWSITGAPVQVLRPDSEVEKIRDAEVEGAAKAQELAQAGAGAGIAKDATQAEKNLADSKRGKK